MIAYSLFHTEIFIIRVQSLDSRNFMEPSLGLGAMSWIACNEQDRVKCNAVGSGGVQAQWSVLISEICCLVLRRLVRTLPLATRIGLPDSDGNDKSRVSDSAVSSMMKTRRVPEPTKNWLTCEDMMGYYTDIMKPRPLLITHARCAG
jgi:hypothetical protein